MIGEPAAFVYRGETVEAVHSASIAVVDHTGKLTHYLGDPHHVTMARSSIKPFQVLPLIITGAADHFRLSPKQIAIMCGSHNGSDDHRRVVMSNLQACDLTDDYLKCGTHLPIYMQEQGLYPTAGEDEDPARHNCSGKHSGFLALAKFLGDDLRDYLNPESKSQTMVREMVGRMTDFPVTELPVSVDGCSAPNFPITPFNLALGFKRLAAAEGDAPEVGKALDRIKAAMTEHPEMVSGEKRFDLDLMRSYPGKVFCKVGAEGIEGIGFEKPSLGIAVKVHDGNWRALWPICVEVLKQLGLVAKIDDFPYLRRHARPEVRNNRNLVTGHVVADFQLHNA
jgi:L-asparaginase II